jgi:hypothetical protein
MTRGEPQYQAMTRNMEPDPTLSHYEGVIDHLAIRCAGLAASAAVGAEVLHQPRLWPEYHNHYFATFVRDPDGNNVEAVCHRPE